MDMLCTPHQVFRVRPDLKLNTIFVGLPSPIRLIFVPESPKVIWQRLHYPQAPVMINLADSELSNSTAGHGGEQEREDLHLPKYQQPKHGKRSAPSERPIECICNPLAV